MPGFRARREDWPVLRLMRATQGGGVPALGLGRWVCASTAPKLGDYHPARLLFGWTHRLH